MRVNGAKAKVGRDIRCPKCGYIWKTKQKGYICCSHCKRYFGRFLKK
jgi:rubrerythrin